MKADSQVIGLTARQRALPFEAMARMLFANESQALLPRASTRSSGSYATVPADDPPDDAHTRLWPVLHSTGPLEEGEKHHPLPTLWEWFFSVVPCQVAEFEATFFLNMEAFNMIGSLPVLPGPCQMYDIEKLIRLDVIDKYFQMTQESASSGEESEFDKIVWANARLAEDRILSFLVTAMTDMRTHWVNGTCFYYDPMRTISSLLKQRRRWINGTVVINIWLLSGLAGSRVTGSRQIANKSFLFIQVWQSVVVLLSPFVVIYSIISAIIYLDHTINVPFWRYYGYSLGWAWFGVVLAWHMTLTPWFKENFTEGFLVAIAKRCPCDCLKWCLNEDGEKVIFMRLAYTL